MRRIVGSVAIIGTIGLGLVGSAQAANTYLLCSASAGKGLVSPSKKGECRKHQHAIVLATSSALNSLKTTTASLTGRVGTLESQNVSLTGRVGTLESQNVSLTGRVGTLESQNASLTSRVSTLESKVSGLQSTVSGLTSTLSGVSRAGSTLLFKGMNLQLDSGSGSTSGAVNGLGNLIIGYNENPRTQTGSNNLVIGDDQSFTSYGAIVAGADNTVSAPYASIPGGAANTASGYGSSVNGGYSNTASNNYSAVAGGYANTAANHVSTVAGGYLNVSNGYAGSVLGGQSKNLTTDYGTSYLP